MHEVLVLLEPSEVDLEVEVLEEVLPVVSTLELKVAMLPVVELVLEVVESDVALEVEHCLRVMSKDWRPNT